MEKAYVGGSQGCELAFQVFLQCRANVLKKRRRDG
jgi:hypothetical protein